MTKWEGSNLEVPGFTDYFEYSCEQPELTDFTEWLHKLISTEVFKKKCDTYIDIHKRLKTEKDSETRCYLIMQARQLEETV